jgi:hypothetical protein
MAAEKPLYAALPIAGSALVGIAALQLARQSIAANIGMLILAVPLIAEGFGLLINWHGGTREIVSTLRGETPRSLLGLIPAWSWRLMGMCAAFIGILFMGVAIHDLA